MGAFTDASQRSKWVDRFKAQKDLQIVSEFEKIYWIHFKMPIILSDRDYVLKAVITPDNAKKVVMTNIKSVKFAGKGIDDCCIRAEAFGTFYRFESLPGTGKTKLAVEIQTDPKGWLPAFLVNLIQKNWPRKTLTRLVKVAKQDNVKSHPKFIVGIKQLL